MAAVQRGICRRRVVIMNIHSTWAAHIQVIAIRATFDSLASCGSQSRCPVAEMDREPLAMDEGGKAGL